jgi:NAD(P)-dependent dehydrogenase (short-subunit alcohol dehydrogenase family)
MAERGEGVVVNLIAPVVSPGRRGLGLYASSKAALESLTSTLRQEVGGKGVTVFGFDPGWVRTDLAPDGREEPEPVAARLVAHIEAGKGSRTPLT